MKKKLLVSTSNNKFSMVSLFIILLSSFCIFQSCGPLFEISADRSKVRYEITPIGGIRRVSPSPEDYAFNIALMFVTGANAYNNSNIFNNKSFNNTSSMYANNNVKEHGPSNTEIENAEINLPQLQTSSSPTDLSKNIRFMGGIEFIGKGEPGAHSWYFEVPLYATYWYHLPGGNIFGGLGPYLAYGFGTPFSNGGFNPFDAGLTFTGGYKMVNSFSFGVGYDLGLVNIEKNPGTDNVTNRTISLSIGYPVSKIIKKKH